MPASAVVFLFRCAQHLTIVADSYIARAITGMIMVAIDVDTVVIDLVDAEKTRYTVRGATSQDKVERE